MFAALALLVIPLPSAAAQPASSKAPAKIADKLVKTKLKQAEQAFKVQDYGRVVSLLQPLLPMVDAGEAVPEAFQRIKFYERLAAALWFEEQKDASRRVFTALLKTAPTYRLEALFYPEQLIRFFENHRADLVSYGVIGKGGATSGPRQVKVRETRIHTTPTFAYLMPLGVGQFANGEDTKGAIVLTLQLIGIIATVSAYAVSEQLHRADPKQNAVAASDEQLNEAMVGISIGGWALFGTTLVYGIIDGFVNRPPSETVIERTEVLDPDDQTPPKPIPDPGVSWRVGPASRGLGVGLGGSF